MNDASSQLAALRGNIDRIDAEIMELLAERQRTVRQIGQVKQDHQLPVYDAHRELSARTQRKQLAKKLGIDPLRIEVLFEQIVLLARETQEKGASELDLNTDKQLRIGVMGGIASFSEAAALQFLKSHHIDNYEIFYPISSENVLKDLAQEKIDLGIFPIENSTAGIVVESIQAMSQYQFDIQEIFDFDVVHCLHVLPGVEKSDIRKIMSHPQALKQCKGYLAKNFPDAELIEATDTAEGARNLEQSPEERELAVIAPKRAGELYHLDTLEEGIQDLDDNSTRFIAASRSE